MGSNRITTALLIASACVVTANTLQYSDLEELGVETCPFKNSCPQASPKFSERICECDRSCAFYKDCCIDASRGRPRRITTQICKQFGVFSHDGVYVFADCPSKFEGPTEIRDQCRNGDSRDPILNAPVTDTLNRKTYLNSYCALCHEASPTNLTIWPITLCKVLNRPSVDITFSDLQYREDIRRWGIVQEEEFKSCDFGFNKPKSIDRIVRFCRPNLVSSCPDDYTNDAILRACESYVSASQDTDGTTYYRNPHCALCNGLPVDDIKCFDPFGLGRGQKPFSFALLFDINRKDGDRVGMRNTCASGEKYDPFFKKCRTLVCSIPGYTMGDEKCVKQT